MGANLSGCWQRMKIKSEGNSKVNELNIDAFKHVCWLHTRFMITRYLMSNAEGRWDGAEKALRHTELCQFYVAAVRGHDDPDTVRRQFEDDYQAVHSRTQELTDRMDEAIGFPLVGQPKYDKLDRLFFDRFHELAISALGS